MPGRATRRTNTGKKRFLSLLKNPLHLRTCTYACTHVNISLSPFRPFSPKCEAGGQAAAAAAECLPRPRPRQGGGRREGHTPPGRGGGGPDDEAPLQEDGGEQDHRPPPGHAPAGRRRRRQEETGQVYLSNWDLPSNYEQRCQTISFPRTLLLPPWVVGGGGMGGFGGRSGLLFLLLLVLLRGLPVGGQPPGKAAAAAAADPAFRLPTLKQALRQGVFLLRGNFGDFPKTLSKPNSDPSSNLFPFYLR